MAFLASKILWTLAQPGNLLLAALVSGILLSALGGGARRWGRVLSTAAALGLIGATFLPLGSWALQPLERRFPQPQAPERLDGILLLGGMVDQFLTAAHGQPALTDAAERLVEFSDLARRHPEARLVIAGGSGYLRGQELKEGPVIAEALRRMGFAVERIAFETESRNTHENIRNAFAIARPQPGERWALVTSAFHMPRAVGIARVLGWPVIPWPVDYRTGGMDGFGPASLSGGLRRLDMAAREWCGLAGYRMLGWTNALFPAP
ncbi:YdcF family protein [Arenibaculum pallidiluteum]|uniref:YdcF family protein n=1 Tax=Arenibaculum pallidiluteum TaxID=2812559 RepID=UPI001A9785C4|nr:YdcF family protein [Arenibaculum pallidiluteum]